jgi:5,10-methylenetetrahydromethanopterin reductase
MRIGTSIHPQLDPDPVAPHLRFVEMVRSAEAYGYSHVGPGDGQGGLEMMCADTLIATVTARMQVRVSVTNPVTRDVGVMAAGVASVNAISGDRAFLLLGRGDGAVNNVGRKAATVETTRQYLLAIRELLEKGTTTYKGRTVRLMWPRLPGRKIPLHLVAEGPRMLHLAGEVADGVLIGTGLTPELIEDSLDRVYAGARAAGRNPSDIEVWWGSRSSIAPTYEEALEEVQESLSSAGNHSLRGTYEGKLIPPEIEDRLRRYHEGYDWAEKGRRPVGGNVRLMQQLGLVDYFLSRFGVVGSPAEVVERLRQLRSYGVESIQLGSHNPRDIQLIGEQVLPFVS